MTAPAPRTASRQRRTGETEVSLDIALDGTGTASIETGVGFLDHMLTLLARHALIDLTVRAKGDTHVDFHHVTEDIGIVLGQALEEALGEKRGITRYGSCLLPMDEALARVALDLSGRPMLVWNVAFNWPKVGEMDTELFREFFQAIASNARMTLHVARLEGFNDHHVAEACFKGFGRALRQAIAIDARAADAIPSTKGNLVG
ncbi:MAG: imidazoleglycerol-phosphate dehydratase HisB [Pseudomonadota bacterium]